MAMSEWILVTKKSKKRRSSTSKEKCLDLQGEKNVQRASATHFLPSPCDPNHRVSSAKKLSIQRQIERISSLLQQDAIVCNTVNLLANEPKLSIICYGLGSFCTSTNAIYQLAFIKALSDVLKERQSSLVQKFEVYDPVMNGSDRDIAKYFGIETIVQNECGKREVHDKTLFYMPHCGQQMYRNVLLTNWKNSLQHVIIIGNSFKAYDERLIIATTRQQSLLVNILPYLTETSLCCGLSKTHNDYTQCEAAFIDMSLHTFTTTQMASAHADVSLSVLVSSLLLNSTEECDEELIVDKLPR